MKKLKKVKQVTAKTLQNTWDNACSDGREILENLYPDFFEKESVIASIIKDIGRTCYGYEVTSEDTYIKIKLPNNNKQWTLKAFEYVKKVCDKYPACFVRHNGIQNQSNNYLYIDCYKLTK